MVVDYKTLFPPCVTYEYLNEMPRRELTEVEKSRPYAKYYHKDMGPIPAHDLAIVNAGPLDPAEMVSIDCRNDMLKPGYVRNETGYTLFPDGTACAATLVKMKGVTPDMLDWWFNWHTQEGLRYAIWSPAAHTDISAKDPDGHKDISGVDMKVRNYNKVHYPVEGFDLAHATTLEIAFRDPADYLDMSLFKEPNISSCFLATVSAVVGDTTIPISVIMHSVRKVSDGVEYRSRYWLGWTIKDGKIVKSDRLLPPEDILARARCTAYHSLTEYNNLASFLPELYEAEGGKIL